MYHVSRLKIGIRTSGKLRILDSIAYNSLDKRICTFELMIAQHDRATVST